MTRAQEIYEQCHQLFSECCFAYRLMQAELSKQEVDQEEYAFLHRTHAYLKAEHAKLAAELGMM